MRRKILTVLITAVLCISLVGCNKSTGGDSKQAKNEVKETDTTKESEEKIFEGSGVKFKLPNKWKAKEKNIEMFEIGFENTEIIQLDISFRSDETMDKFEKLEKDLEKIPETDQAKIKEIKEKRMDLYDEIKKLCTVTSIDKSKVENEDPKELFPAYENKDLIGKEGNLEFYLLYNKPDTNGLSEKSKKDYEEIYGEIKNFKSLIKILSEEEKLRIQEENLKLQEEYLRLGKEKLSKYKKFEFKTKTIDGKGIDSSILKDSKLTMVNIWGTFCGPCMDEMPDIQKLYEEVKGEKINVIGLIGDTPDEDNEELAKEILSKIDVKYTNIIPDESIKNSILEDVSTFPTTFFVDSEGNIIGDFLMGTKSKEEFKREIEERLKDIK
ncbi:TlpA family protein disulfide reductase [Clostridium sp. UBA6640]|uniref:TlpA family protein disulfide reductase n=1 Tax=Clostridium sp. UBA6640 TaxID=1946370 RepID=UPI0025BDDAF4|nr:TlpA disulfide reductase family protein [Clostridium sp. UBA6640]